jgi:hypothetical protein
MPRFQSPSVILGIIDGLVELGAFIIQGLGRPTSFCPYPWMARPGFIFAFDAHAPGKARISHSESILFQDRDCVPIPAYSKICAQMADCSFPM